MRLEHRPQITSALVPGSFYASNHGKRSPSAGRLPGLQVRMCHTLVGGWTCVCFKRLCACCGMVQPTVAVVWVAVLVY